MNTITVFPINPQGKRGLPQIRSPCSQQNTFYESPDTATTKRSSQSKNELGLVTQLRLVQQQASVETKTDQSQWQKKDFRSFREWKDSKGHERGLFLSSPARTYKKLSCFQTRPSDYIFQKERLQQQDRRLQQTRFEKFEEEQRLTGFHTTEAQGRSPLTAKISQGFY